MTKTEERLRFTIGNLVIENIVLNSKVEELIKENAELKKPKETAED